MLGYIKLDVTVFLLLRDCIGTEIKVYHALSFQSNVSTRLSHPMRVRDIAKVSGVNISDTYKALQSLTEKGLLEKCDAPYGKVQYKFLIPKGDQSCWM